MANGARRKNKYSEHLEFGEQFLHGCKAQQCPSPGFSVPAAHLMVWPKGGAKLPSLSQLTCVHAMLPSSGLCYFWGEKTMILRLEHSRNEGKEGILAGECWTVL